MQGMGCVAWKGGERMIRPDLSSTPGRTDEKRGKGRKRKGKRKRKNEKKKAEAEKRQGEKKIRGS